MTRVEGADCALGPTVTVKQSCEGKGKEQCIVTLMINGNCNVKMWFTVYKYHASLMLDQPSD